MCRRQEMRWRQWLKEPRNKHWPFWGTWQASGGFHLTGWHLIWNSISICGKRWLKFRYRNNLLRNKKCIGMKNQASFIQQIIIFEHLLYTWLTPSSSSEFILRLPLTLLSSGSQWKWYCLVEGISVIWCMCMCIFKCQNNQVALLAFGGQGPEILDTLQVSWIIYMQWIVPYLVQLLNVLQTFM